MKYSIAIFVCVLSAALAQRPSYAGSRPIGRPDLASRFKDTEESTTSTTVAVDNRGGADTTTVKLPVDARGDADLVNRLNQWPRENQPFWYLNSGHIEASRHPQPQQPDNTQSNVGSQSQNNNGLQNQATTQTRFGSGRNQFSGDDRRFVNNGPDFFQGGVGFESRSNFDQYDPSVQARPIRPDIPRPSFAAAIR